MSWLIAAILLPFVISLLSSPGGRFLLVMLAGLVVFTPGQATLGPKTLFVTLLLSSAVVSVLRLRSAAVKPSSALLAATGLFGAMLIAIALAGWAVDPKLTLQNGLPYILLLLVLPIAIDAGQGESRRFLETCMLVVGLVSALSFTVHWLDRRGVSTLAYESLLATSFLFPALVFQWGLVMAGEKDRGWRVRAVATAVSVLIPFAFLVTGTRSSLVLGFGFAGFAIWKIMKGQFFSTLARGSIAVGIALPILGWVGSKLVSNPEFLERRFEALKLAVTYGAAGDQSIEMRQAANQVVSIALDGNWFFGLGLSTPDLLDRAFDTPLVAIMRIGIVGALLLAVYLVVALRWAMTIAPQNATGDSIRAIIGGWFLVVLAVGLLLGGATDDRLFAFAFAAVIALAVNARSYSDQSASLGGDSSNNCGTVRSGQVGRSISNADI